MKLLSDTFVLFLSYYGILILCFHNFIYIEILPPNRSSSARNKSVSFAQSGSSLPIYHWDRCVERSIVIDDNTNGMVTFIQNIRAVFREELDGKSFRLYSMPPNFSDLKDRIRIQTWEEVSTFIDAYFFHVVTCKALPLLYIFDED